MGNQQLVYSRHYGANIVGYFVNTVLTVMSLEQVLVALVVHDDRSRLDTDVSFALQQSSKHGQLVVPTR